MIVPCQKKRSCILFLINARFIYPGLNNVARYQAIAIFIIKPIAQTAKRALARTRIAKSKMRGKTAIKRAHASLKARKRTSAASFAKPSRCPTLTDIHKKRRSKERRLLFWWRRGESNSGPYYVLAQALQAYFAIEFRKMSVREPTSSFLARSFFSKAIQTTCFEAVP